MCGIAGHVGRQDAVNVLVAGLRRLEFLTAIPVVLAEQLSANYAALARGCPIDQPRNLAKAVTVE